MFLYCSSTLSQSGDSRSHLLQPSLPHTPATSLPVLQPNQCTYTTASSQPTLTYSHRFAMDSDDIKACTVVFKLSRGQQVVPLDFAPHLEVVAGRIQGFGTVGVGHILHLTLTSQCYVEDVIAQGDFSIRGRTVVASKLSTSLLSAVLYWLPFWVKHEDVITSLGKLLDDTVTCEYIRIDQKGFPGCYSTQRKIYAAADLRNLPHFIQIESEGETYRTFLFVPGRVPACFACNAIGHMKSSCPVAQNTANVPAPAVPVPHTQEDVSSEETSVHESASPAHSSDGDVQNDVFESTTHPTYHIWDRKSRKAAPAVMKHKGKVVQVIPPKETHDKAKFDELLQCCTEISCAGIDLFRKEQVSAEDMESHIRSCHFYILRLERC